MFFFYIIVWQWRNLTSFTLISLNMFSNMMFKYISIKKMNCTYSISFLLNCHKIQNAGSALPIWDWYSDPSWKTGVFFNLLKVCVQQIQWHASGSSFLAYLPMHKSLYQSVSNIFSDSRWFRSACNEENLMS